MSVVLLGSGATAITRQTSPYTHFKGAWGAIQTLPGFAPANIAASQVVTTGQGNTIYCPFPYQWIYDIAFHLNSSSNHDMTLDVYNTLAAGTSANSYFSGAIPVPKNIASGAIGAYFSARTLYTTTQGYKPADDPFIAEALASGASGVQWASTYVVPAGTIFSLRAVTPGGASITGLKMTVLVVPWDVKVLGQ